MACRKFKERRDRLDRGPAPMRRRLSLKNEKARILFGNPGLLRVQKVSKLRGYALASPGFGAPWPWSRQKADVGIRMNAGANAACPGRKRSFAMA